MSKSPGELLKIFVNSYIYDNNLSDDLKLEIPKKWEKYGDFVLFDMKSFCSDVWQQQGEEFWKSICEILKCKRIALKSKIRSDNYRTPCVKMLVGDDPWILSVDNGIKYSWNVEKNMFCAGNASERHRIAKLNCYNETVVDLFAGIGYFVLPFLIHAKAKVVHACEWNPDAVVALKRNLILNKVEDKCIIYEGDNRDVCPKGIANRVNLGLIPSSERSWKVACEALLPSGGILHIHGNVETLNENITCKNCINLTAKLVDNCAFSLETGRGVITNMQRYLPWKHRQWYIWAVHVLHSLISILFDMNSTCKWICKIEDVHGIKSYAPHVDHVVLDISLSLL